MNTKTTNENLVNKSNQTQQKQSELINKKEFIKLSLPQQVIKELPSWKSIHDIYVSRVVEKGLELEFGLEFKTEFQKNNVDDQWESIVKLVDHMCTEMYDLGWYSDYQIEINPETGFCKNGYGELFTSRGDIIRVTGDEFLSCTKVLFTSFFRMWDDRKLNELVSNFKTSTKDINQILN